MKAKFVKDVLNESSEDRIIFKTNVRELREKYPEVKIFKSLFFADIINEIQRAPKNNFINGKLDLLKFYNYLKTKGEKHNFEEVKALLLEAAPFLGIVEQLKLSREEKPDLSFQEKVYSGEIDLSYYLDAEISAEEAKDTDYVLRSKEGETEPAYFRFDKKLTQHEVNMLKASYVSKYGDPTKSLYKNYMAARPAQLGNIKKLGRSIYHTKDIEDYEGKEYD